MNKKILKDMLVLIAVIVFCAIAARFLAGGETLEDYAKKNPEKASNAASSEMSEDTAQMSAANVELKASDEQKENEDRITYMDGFYYEPISNDIFRRISGISYPVDCDVPLEELRHVGLKYVDFNGDEQTGELICNVSIAEDLVEIFHELFVSGYQLESIKLIDEFEGDDTASMLANNTSCFNYRMVEGTNRLSNHAYGLAIDINPFYNPYITYGKDGSVKISPEGSEPYADRDANFPYKIDENDLCYKLFKAHGFKWGGDWNNSKDYQHFEKKG
ncbi:MAG: M15 family metallopeptidase [Butyrivibrio sp.]|nr:M15 family metallopeptidase [Butyrivibrio sp.]